MQCSLEPAHATLWSAKQRCIWKQAFYKSQGHLVKDCLPKMLTYKQQTLLPLLLHQAAAYPTLGADDLIRERHLAAHHAAFPEGQHCAIDEATNEVLGMNCTLLLDRCVAEG